MANIQKFVVGLHNAYHELHSEIEGIKHLRDRLKRANQEVADKAQMDLDNALSSLREKMSKIETSYTDPYMEKTKVYYPEVYANLQKLKARVAVLTSQWVK